MKEGFKHVNLIHTYVEHLEATLNKVKPILEVPMHENTHGKEAEESDTSGRSAALVNFVNNNCGN